MDLQFLYVEEVASELRAPTSSVRLWVSSGRLPGYRLGRRLLVRRKDLDRFVEKCLIANRANDNKELRRAENTVR